VEARLPEGGILCINGPCRETIPIFIEDRNCTFKHKVVPGIPLILNIGTAESIRRGICENEGNRVVGNKVVTEADMMAQLVKEKLRVDFRC